MKSAIYLRVSTENQEREGTSIDSQRVACLKLAEEQGYEVPSELVFTETYTGLSISRPKLNELRQLVRDKAIEAVIAYTLDRLSRNPVHFIILQEEMERAGVELIFATEGIDSSDLGRLITYIKGYAAKLEAEKIKERTSRGRRTRIATGRLAGGQACYLYGYDYIPGRGEGEGIRRVNEEQAQLVRNIYHWFAEEQLPLNGVVYRLRELGVLSPTGKLMWSTATVHKMLTKPAYCGLAGRATPPIIDEETFANAGARLKRNREMASRNVKRDYLLRGYLYCQYCGKRYHGVTKQYQTEDGIREYLYYVCRKDSRLYADPCSNRSWRGDHLENLVWREVESALVNPDIILAGLEALKKEADKTNSHISELKTIEDRISELDKQQEQLLQWALKGFSEKIVIGENEKINQDRERLIHWKAEVEAQMEASRQAEINIDDIREACSLIRENTQLLSFTDKRLALEALRIKVLLKDNEVTIQGFLPVASTSLEPSRNNQLKSIPFCIPLSTV